MKHLAFNAIIFGLRSSDFRLKKELATRRSRQLNTSPLVFLLFCLSMVIIHRLLFAGLAMNNLYQLHIKFYCCQKEKRIPAFKLILLIFRSCLVICG